MLRARPRRRYANHLIWLIPRWFYEK
ncbi:hypothetical protein SAMN05428981_1162 [Bacillus sp. OV194]|nr:hypothetical protein SAMN05428981_1162 [Bacillus sp. OV194]